uniref:Uncharacterized protein n=1 Tax=Rhizophora mucronata TaxID=61149 RepID=A0A2P2MRD3_RHIMU
MQGFSPKILVQLHRAYIHIHPIGSVRCHPLMAQIWNLGLA